MALEITNQGLFKNSNINEYLIEPDGSVWEHVFHHNNPASNLFSSSDAFTTGVYKSKDAWFNFQVCNSLSSSWEFLIVQLANLNSKTYKFRWAQTKNPLTAAYADVAASAISKNISTGYTSFSTGGLFKKNSSTYLCTNNGSESNWWGAIGSWNLHQSGIPCWNGSVVTNGCVDVYVRVDSISHYAKFYKTGLQVCNNFYEN